MKILKSVLLLFALLVLIWSTQGCGNAECVLTGFVNCGNGGGADKSIINGTVLDVIGGPGVSGIKVRAERNGEKVASDTTNSEGEFKLKVREGNITLLFEILGEVTVGRAFTITEDSEVFLDVILDLVLPQIEVEDWDVVQDPIRCGGSDEVTFEGEDAISSDFTIDGDGTDCIKANGDCTVEIVAQNITLTDCKNGVLAEGTADVILGEEAAPISISINIDDNNNGVHTEDDSSVLLTGTDIFITSDSNGILATNDSNVDVIRTGDCTIEGGDKAVNEQDDAMVDPDGCNLVQP